MRARTSVSGAAADSKRQAASRSSSVPVDVEQLDRGARPRRRRGGRARAARPSSSVALAALLQVGDPLAAAVGALDPGDEARHHLLQLAQDHAAVLARLRQRRGHQPQQQLLVGLSRGVDADVAQRRRGQQAAQQVERLGADRAPPGPLGLAVAARPALGGPRLDPLQRARVDREELVHRRAELGPELARRGSSGSRRRRPRAAACRRGCSGSTARGRRPVDPAAAPWSARWRPTRRRRGRRRPGRSSRRRSRGRRARRGPRRALPRPRRRAASAAGDVGRELLQVEAAHRPGIPRIAGKKRPLDRLRQVDEGEHGPVEVGEVRGEQGPLLGGELLDRVAHRRIVVPGPAGPGHPNPHDRR